MARRIVRTLCKALTLSAVLAVLLLLLDTRYSVLLPSTVHSGVHLLLPEHHAGTVVTDIAYRQCARLSACLMPADSGGGGDGSGGGGGGGGSGGAGGGTRGGWQRIEKDVFLRSSWLQHGFVSVRRKREDQLAPAAGDKVVVDIRVSRSKPAATDGAGDHDVEWESRGNDIWVKRQAAVASSAVVTAIDLLFGPDAVEVRPGWQLKEGTLASGQSARITLRRGPAIVPPKASVQMNKNHMLKIIQVAGVPSSPLFSSALLSSLL